jgi:hypothetical protein
MQSVTAYSKGLLFCELLLILQKHYFYFNPSCGISHISGRQHIGQH